MASKSLLNNKYYNNLYVNKLKSINLLTTDNNNNKLSSSFNDILRARTPLPNGLDIKNNGWPPLILKNCSEPLNEKAVDMRGVWKPISITNLEQNITIDIDNISLQRIEQAGLRTVITADLVIHDMICDDTLDGAVYDVTNNDLETNIVVIAKYLVENNKKVHGLRPIKPFELQSYLVKRWIEIENNNQYLICQYPYAEDITKAVLGQIELEEIKTFDIKFEKISDDFKGHGI